MSESNKFTPGPWFVSGQITKYVEARICGGMIQEVAACGPTDADGGYGEQQIANATLIAAAPDLLEALEGMIGLFPTGVEDDGSGIGFNETLKQKYRNAVIASKKARGQQ